MKEPLKILIVDDSRIFRSAVEKVLGEEADFKIIGSVRNGVKAMEFIRTTAPDIVTLDIEMPEMDGLETLRSIQELKALKPDMPDIGVIMVSSHTVKGAETTIRALEYGAFDFVEKPVGNDPEASLGVLRNSLTMKIRQYAIRRRKNGAPTPSVPVKETAAVKRTYVSTGTPSSVKAIVIGVSTGGPKALVGILPELSSKIDLPIFIVQHMPPLFTGSLAASLDTKCRHRVIEASHDDVVENDRIYIAPGGRHMVVAKNGTGNIVTMLNEQPPENGCRPAVDVLFRSAASAYGNGVIAIILTGMGNDGTKGLGPLKRAGARVIVQDEETSVVWGMPGSAVASGYVDEVVPLQKIPDTVKEAIEKREV